MRHAGWMTTTFLTVLTLACAPGPAPSDDAGFAGDAGSTDAGSGCDTPTFSSTGWVKEIALASTCCFDFDGDATLDNAIGSNALMPALLNPKFTEGIAAGTPCLLLDLDGMSNAVTSGPFAVVLASCVDADGSPEGNTAGTGQFLVREDTYDAPICAAHAHRLLQADGVVNGHLVAHAASMPGALLDNPMLPVFTPLNDVRLEADLVTTSTGLEARNVKLGGTVFQGDLLEGLNALVEEGAELPLSPETFMTMLGTPDLDTDEDGEFDSFSVGYTLGTSSAKVTGWVPR